MAFTLKSGNLSAVFCTLQYHLSLSWERQVSQHNMLADSDRDRGEDREIALPCYLVQFLQVSTWDLPGYVLNWYCSNSTSTRKHRGIFKINKTENYTWPGYAHSRISKHSSNLFSEFHITPDLQAMEFKQHPACPQPPLSRWDWETLSDLCLALEQSVVRKGCRVKETKTPKEYIFLLSVSIQERNGWQWVITADHFCSGLISENSLLNNQPA